MKHIILEFGITRVVAVLGFVMECCSPFGEPDGPTAYNVHTMCVKHTDVKYTKSLVNSTRLLLKSCKILVKVP